MYQLKEKEVSGKAMKRLRHAKDAIEYTKQVFTHGAGNQENAIRASRVNSFERLKVVRNDNYWKLTFWAKILKALYPMEYHTAKAYIAQGGNCGEHALVAYDFLKLYAKGEEINYASKKGLDHAFVVLGNTSTETDNELAVSDPWPTQATATLWSDHFAFTSDRSKLKVSKSTIANGYGASKVIAAGLSLTDEGKKALENSSSGEETEEFIKEKDFIWNHSNSARKNHQFDYYSKDDEGEKDFL